MADKKTIVSILTPTYNHGQYLGECIESAQRQTMEYWEMLILDDGSNDETADVARAYAAKDSRVKYLRQDNIGIFRLSETYNKGLAMAQGDFIAILEGDDYWEDDKLMLQTAYMSEHPGTVVSWGQAYSRSSDKQEVYGLFPSFTEADLPTYNNNPLGNIYNIFFYRNCIPALTMLIRKDALERIGGFKQSYGLPLVDITTLYELAGLGEFYFIPRSLGSWRIYGSQITKTYTAEILEGFISLALNSYQKLSERSDLQFSADPEKLMKHYTRQRVITYSRAGRYKLIRHDFRNARKDYVVSMTRGGFIEIIWKLRSLTGYIFSLLHLDVEGLAGLLGKKQYKKQ